MAASYLNFQQPDLEMDVTDNLVPLQSCLRTLLNTFDGSPENATDVEPGMTFAVCMDGRRYTITILETAMETDDSQHRLTAREQDVVRLISKGFTTKTIALVLGLKPCTVSTYTKRIYLKLNVNSRAEMVAKVLNKPSLFVHSMH
jgi:DNA-binding CsgD family transcriptional regulator